RFSKLQEGLNFRLDLVRLETYEAAPAGHSRVAGHSRGLRSFINPWRPGAIAQLGERLHGMQEVSGSIPLGSTILFPPLAIAANTLNGKVVFGVLSPSFRQYAKRSLNVSLSTSF